MSTFSIGLIGAGAIIGRHVEAIHLTPEYDVIGVCDLDRERAQKVASEFDNCDVFVDYRKLLERRPDAVVLALPHNLHCEVSSVALRAGCHVLVEKPMATSPVECRTMLETAAECDRRLYVAELASYGNGQLATGRKFREGLLGRFFTGCIIDNRTYDMVNRPAWGLSAEGSGGGLFANVGVHRLALARACLPGLVPRSASGWVSRFPQYEIEACTSGMVKYDDGGAMHYEATGYFGRAPYGLTTHFVFEEGIVAWDETHWMIYNEHKGGLIKEEIEPNEPAYVPVYRQFHHMLSGKTDCEPKAYEYAIDVAVAHAMYASSESGKEIDVLRPPWDLTDLQ